MEGTVLQTTTELNIVAGVFTLVSTYSGEQNPNVTYEIEFAITDGVSPLENAIIEINSVQYFTNVSGIANIELIRGNYEALISKSGYGPKTYNFTISGSNLTANIELETNGSFDNSFDDSFEN